MFLLCILRASANCDKIWYTLHSTHFGLFFLRHGHHHHHIRLLNNRQNAVAQTEMRGDEIQQLVPVRHGPYMYWVVSWCTKSNVPVAPPVRRAAELVLAAGLDDAGDERFEQDLVILLFFVLPASPRVADSAPPLDLDVSLPDDDKLLELPDSLPFSATVTVTPLQPSAT